MALRQDHAWSTATVSVAITAYDLMGALVVAVDVTVLDSWLSTPSLTVVP